MADKIAESNNLVSPDKNDGNQEERSERLKFYARSVASGNPKQHEIVGEMKKEIDQELDQRTIEQKGKEPVFQTDIQVLIQTEKGHHIGTKMKANNFKIVFPLGEYREEDVLEALAKTFPDSEKHTKMPSFFPAKFIADQQERSEKFLGIRMPTPKLEGVGVRAFWLLVNNESSDFESFPSLGPKNMFQEFRFSFKSLSVQFEPEIKHSDYKDKNGNIAYYLNIYTFSGAREIPYLSKIQEKIGSFLKNLLGDDKVASLSVYYDGLDIPITPQEAQKFDEFKKLDSEKKTITFKKGNIIEKTEQIKNTPVFSFKTGVNEYGVLEDRSDSSYLLPYLFTRVKLHPGGLEFDQLDSEISRLRWA